MDEVNSSDNQPATKGDLGLLKGDLGLLKGDLGLLKGDLGLLKGDLGLLKGDMGILKGDMGILKDDMGLLKSDLSHFRDEMRELIRPITITLAHHTAELADIRGHIKDKMVTREEFHSRMDGFTGKVQDFEYSLAKNRELLVDHDKRIKALDDGRSA